MTDSTKNNPPLTREQLIHAQLEYCKSVDSPMFASYSGGCWRCGRDIVDDSWDSRVVTGCKFCHRSFVD